MTALSCAHCHDAQELTFTRSQPVPTGTSSLTLCRLQVAASRTCTQGGNRRRISRWIYARRDRMAKGRQAYLSRLCRIEATFAMRLSQRFGEEPLCRYRSQADQLCALARPHAHRHHWPPRGRPGLNPLCHLPIPYRADRPARHAAQPTQCWVHFVVTVGTNP